MWCAVWCGVLCLHADAVAAAAVVVTVVMFCGAPWQNLPGQASIVGVLGREHMFFRNNKGEKVCAM